MPRAKVTLQNFFQYCISRKLPFAFYRLPETQDIKVCAQKTNKLRVLTPAQSYSNSTGFLFAPFRESKTCPTILIKADILCTENSLPALDFLPKSSYSALTEQEVVAGTTRSEFMQQVEAIKKEIQQGNFKKIVAARVSTVKAPEQFSAVAFFKKLCSAYPHAFVSLVYTPLSGIWIGATPEVLLSVTERAYTTYSLAGTRTITTQAQQQKWGEKEKEEQRIVSNFIEGTFKKTTNRLPVIKGPVTVNAGNLLHLRTTFCYRGIPYKQWKKVAGNLHPTPAVGGLPQRKAVSYITRHEKFSRKYYSGYLGPVNINKQTKLYVNLRCMNVAGNQLVLYTGCGITAHSIAAKEWRETELKMNTLLNVLA